jgi:tRNA (guanine26-N2/guanine27-N2)-dimethyltransferase
MNVEYNDAGTPPKAATPAAGEELSPEEKEMNGQAVEGESQTEGEKENTSRRRPGCDGYVTVNESDAWYVRRSVNGQDWELMDSMLMYEHRHPAKRVEVVDLDPYGTAAPFIDGAVQCVADGG